MAASRANSYLCKTVDPNNLNGPKIDAIIPAELYLRYYKYSPVRYENLRAAKYVLENTQVIFWGVREFNQGGWCYIGQPDEWYIAPGTVVPFSDDKVFAVYMNPTMRVYECRAEPADHKNPMFPKDWENRYGGLIWQNIS